MDPVTAIGLASGILTFITFGTKVVRGALEIYESPDGVLRENQSRKAIADEMQRFSAKLTPPSGSQYAGKDEELCILAAECQALSAQLVHLLERSHPKNPKSKMQSFWAAMKNKMHEDERAELEQRLDHCRSQLDLQLTFLTSQESKTSWHALLESLEGERSKLQQLQSSFDELRQALQTQAIGESAQNQVRQLVDVEEGVARAIARKRILEALAFDDMHIRYEMVDDAHTETFRWIFDNENSSCSASSDSGSVDSEENLEAEQIKQNARTRLLAWLASGQGIFHISGKLGSGKSTLMKYLYEHPQTRVELEKWAGSRALVCPSFFFWRPGSDMQKSISGLYRCLLHDALKSLPGQMPNVMPLLWEQAIATPWQATTRMEIPDRQVREGFTLLTQSRRPYSDHCFCFFIDGLDEFQETAQRDHKDLVDLLSGWARVCPQDVKLCVSSREHNVFMNAFSPNLRMRLHELTEHDMKAYVRNRLPRSHVQSSYGATSIAASVANKAQGIFLWVVLVTKAMRRQIDSGAGPHELEELLDGLPDELDTLYQHILKSLDWVERRRAYKTFALLETAKLHDVQLFPFAYSYFDEYEADENFAEQVSPTEPLSDSMICQREDLARKRLTSRCMGLVEFAIREKSSRRHPCLDYTHRSVPEFLQNIERQNELKHHLKRFDAVDAISEMLLAVSRDSFHYDSQIKPLLIMRHKHALDFTTPFAFLERLDATRAARLALGGYERSEPDLSGPSQIIDVEAPEPFSFYTILSPHAPLDSGTEWDSLLPFFMFMKDHPYPLWKVSHDPTVTSNLGRRLLVCYTALVSHYWCLSMECPILEFLFDTGKIEPNMVTTLRMGDAARYEGQHDITIWQHYLVFQCCRRFRDSWRREHKAEHEGSLAVVVEQFLRHSGTDPVFTATFQREGVDMEWHGNFRIGKTNLEVKCELGPKGHHLGQRLSPIDKATPLLDSFDLQEWIEQVDVPNKSALLRLLRERKEPLIESGKTLGDTADEEVTGLAPQIHEDRGITNIRAQLVMGPVSGISNKWLMPITILAISITIYFILY